MGRGARGVYLELDEDVHDAWESYNMTDDVRRKTGKRKQHQ
jgi:hypothetical protein